MEPLDAALEVLRQRGEPLHWTVILDRALQQGLLDPLSDPRGTLLGALADATRRTDGPIVKAGKGIYDLRAPRPNDRPAQ